MNCSNCGEKMALTEDEGDYTAECKYCGRFIENGIVTQEGNLREQEESEE